MGLTFSEDRLPAISGVAKQFKSVLKDDYLAGCWRKSLPDDICWYLVEFPTDRSRPVTGSPTWSWASAPQAALAWHTYSWPKRVEIHHAETYPCTDDDTGQVSGGRIELEGIAVKVCLTYCDLDRDYTNAIEFCKNLAMVELPTKTSLTGSIAARLYPDLQFWESLDDFKEQLADVTFLVMIQDSTVLDGLLLKEKWVNGSMVGFERLGWLEVFGNDYMLSRIDAWRTRLTII